MYNLIIIYGWLLLVIFLCMYVIIKFYLQEYNTVNTKGQMPIQGTSTRKTLSMQQSNGTNRKTHVYLVYADNPTHNIIIVCIHQCTYIAKWPHMVKLQKEIIKESLCNLPCKAICTVFILFSYSQIFHHRYTYVCTYLFWQFSV